MFFRYINETRFGYRSTKQDRVRKPLNLGILENLKCHKLDEYPVISIEDEVPVPPLACNFSKGSHSRHVLALVDENGSAVLYNTNLNGEDAIITDWCAHHNAVFDVEWTHNENKLLTASGDQSIALWDVTNKQKLLTFKGHTSSVRSVRYRPYDTAVFASGSRDGHVRVWDSRCNVKEDKVSCVNVIKNAHCVNQQIATKRKKSRPGGPSQSQDSQQSVTCVLFQNDNLLTTSGAIDGCVKVWDLRKIKQENNTAVYSFPYVGTSKKTHGFSSLVFDSHFTKLYANCTDDVIYCYDFISYNTQPVCTYKGHRNTSFYVRSALSPDNEFLLSGSSDEFAYIWQVSKPNASPVLLKGHGSEISDVAWCNTDLFRVVTTSDDNSMRVWRYDPTAELRRKLGRSDISCGIVGSAERTHRDIGTCVDEAPGPSAITSTSPARPAVKRAATVSTFGPVVEQSPKQAKTCLKSSASPSIKMWLKRSASDTQTVKPGTSQETSATTQGMSASVINNKSESVKLGTSQGSSASVQGTSTSVVNNKSESDDKECLKNCFSVASGSETGSKTDKSDSIKTVSDEHHNSNEKPQLSPSKRQKLDFGGDKNSDNSKNNHIGVKKSCKRKLVEDDSPKKCKRPRADENDVNTENKSDLLVVKDGGRVISPLKDLNSVMNKSPDKCDNNMNIFSSPARGVLHEWASAVYQSPTANLPNIVVDGPQRKVLSTPGKSKTIDWLTQIRQEKHVKLSPSSKKSIKLEEKLTCSPSAATKTSKGVEDIPSTKILAPSTPKLKSPIRGVRSITSFFNRQLSSK